MQSSELSPALAQVLREAAVRAGGSEDDIALPSLENDAIDELIPPELLEPLDAPLDTLAEESLGSQFTPPPHAVGESRRGSSRSSPALSRSPTPTITPLPVGGEMRLTGTHGRYGAGIVLGAAFRSRASGFIVIRSGGEEYGLSLTSGHLLAVCSSRGQDEIGPLLARLGYIPREAAQFAAVPLDAGMRGAALIAARGYLAPDALAQALSRAAREIVFDLLALPEIEWEMRSLETAAEIPLSPRALDALLLLGARARIEPDTALEELGGEHATVTLKPDQTVLTSLPLTHAEREAVSGTHSTPVGEIVQRHGIGVLPALLALAWLGALRIDGASPVSTRLPSPATPLFYERTRVRALIEAAESRDFFALLGVSEWSTRGAALEALDARRTEVAGLRARHPDVPGLATVTNTLDEVARLLDDAEAWNRYTHAIRVRV